MNKIESLLLELQDEVEKSKKVFGYTVMNQIKILGFIEAIREELPEIIRESKEVLKEKDRIIQDAVDLSLKRTQQAHEEADYLVSTAEITRNAQREAERIMDDAARRAYDMEEDAKQRIDNLLMNTERVLCDQLTLVRNNREELRGELLKGKAEEREE